jgi:hypothetical protein
MSSPKSNQPPAEPLYDYTMSARDNEQAFQDYCVELAEYRKSGNIKRKFVKLDEELLRSHLLEAGGELKRYE